MTKYSGEQLSRRDFIKLGSIALLGLGFRDLPPGGDPYQRRAPTFNMGRTIYSLRYYEKPSISSKELGFYVTDTVVKIVQEAIGDPEPEHNPIWLRTEDGWIHSAYVQPVEYLLNEPLLKIPSKGILVEVTVPFTQAYLATDTRRKTSYRLYYCSTHWANYAFTGNDGNIWYQVYDDRNNVYYQVRGEHLRPVTQEELLPISPGVPGKRIVIDLKKQRLMAYEGLKPVFTTRTATGYFEGDTPLGEYIVERKQPSRHMASDLVGNSFDLPGVPWVCYIAWTGVSLHGTYWHNNYGTPQSHGCINLTPQAAKWIYRWTEPYLSADDDYIETDQGTRVTVL